MSYILEALRKSEQERHRGETPDITTQHDLLPEQLVTAPRSSRMPWIIAGGLALNAVVIVLAVWLLRPGDADVEAPPSASTTVAPAPVAAAPSTPVTEPAPRPTVRAAPEPSTVPATAPQDEPVAEVPVAEVPVAEVPVAEAPVTEAPIAAVAEAPVTEAEPEPTPPAVAARTPAALPAPLAIRDLPDRIQRRIPQLDFATHIYGGAPRYREVTINGRRYAEGERVEGMLLSEITESGVVFDFEGYRFEVSVLEDWDY